MLIIYLEEEESAAVWVNGKGILNCTLHYILSTYPTITSRWPSSIISFIIIIIIIIPKEEEINGGVHVCWLIGILVLERWTITGEYVR